MSEKLFEQNFMTFDLRTLGRMSAETEETEEVNEDETVEEPVEVTTEGSNEEGVPEEATAELEALPNKDDWKAWKDLLDSRLKANSELSAAEKKTEYEVESKFFREYFVENWDRNIGAKLLLLGDPLRKAIKVLGFNPKRNPILGFVTQKRVVDGLLFTGKLNVETFKAIYNAVANKLVAHSEFLRTDTTDRDEYNLIYCPDLYNRSVKDMIEYLTVQSQILKVSASTYTADDQLKNKRAFIDVGDVITEKEEKKRAAEINKLGHDKFTKMVNAKLNSLLLAKEVANIKEAATAKLDTKGQDGLVAKLPNIADKFAAIFLLSTTTDSPKAKSFLHNEHFESLSSDDRLAAVMSLSAKGIMPKGQLNKEDADSLAEKIIASLQQKPE